MKTKQAQDIEIGDKLLLMIDGRYCDVVVGGIMDVHHGDPVVEIRYQSIGLESGGYPHTIQIPRFHNVRILEE